MIEKRSWKRLQELLFFARIDEMEDEFATGCRCIHLEQKDPSLIGCFAHLEERAVASGPLGNILDSEVLRDCGYF